MTRVTRITQPEIIVSLDEAKRHLRVEHGEDDAYIDGLIAVAQGHIDGPDCWLGRSIGVQVLELRGPSFQGFTGGGIVLPYGPVLDLQSVVYRAADGASVTLDASAYRLDDDALLPADDRMWPVTQLRSDAVRVRYRAGYPKAGEPAKTTVPAPIRHAILLMVGDLYANRESGSVGPVYATAKMPTTVENLLMPFRVWRL